MHFVVDTTDSRYQTYNNALSKIENLIGTQLPKIIKAKNQEEAKSLYDKTVKSLNDRNLSLVIEMNSEAYAKCKEKLGITVAWPPYMDNYVNPLDRTKPNGDLSLYRGY